MAENSKKSADRYDVFVVNDIFPDVNKLFQSRIKSLEEIRDNALIVLDTNALLVPYNIGKESLNQIQKTYRLLVTKKRLVIPAQVAREFAKNRTRKVAELFQQLNRKKSRVSKLQGGVYPLLESIEGYQETIRLEQEIDSQLEIYKTAIDKILQQIRDWRWNDPVSLLYGDLFNDGVVFEPVIDRHVLLEDLQFRQTHKIPPGYKDAAKDDDGIGDLLIWHTILQVGKERNANVIFVSGEEKADWWHKSEGQVLYPRYELVDEFRRASDEKSFHITSFSQFLNLFGASESIVKEVREEENQIRSEDLLLEVNYDKEPIYFEQVLSNWNKILELIGGVNQNLPALLRMARPLEVKGSELIIGFDYPIFKDKYDSVLNIDQIMSDVVSSVLNVRGMQVKPVINSEWVSR